MKKIIIVPNPKKDDNLALTKLVAQRLSGLEFDIYMDSAYRICKIEKVRYYSLLPEDAELIVVVGGDGSVIEASRLALKLNIPLLGINLGKVGYLSEIDPDNIDALEALKNGNYMIEEKMLLSAVKEKADGSFEVCDRLAVNDVVISHDNYLGIADFKVENGRGDLVKYRADGVILATPAGSTAYSLSAGGPIVAHTLDSIIVTPVCPHSLFNRSIIYGSDECIKVSNDGAPLIVSVDGRYFTRLESGDCCVISKNDVRFKMITFTENNMFSTLFKKIKVLED